MNTRKVQNREAIYTEPNAQYVKINTNIGQYQPPLQPAGDGKNLLLLSSFPQKYMPSNPNTLGKQQTLKKQVTYSSTSPTSTSSSSSSTSSTNMHTPTSSSEGGDLIIVPSPSSDTDSLHHNHHHRNQAHLYHLTNTSDEVDSSNTPANARDVHMKYNSIRQYIDLTDDESTACLYISNNETAAAAAAAAAVANKMNSNGSNANHFLRSSAV